MSDFKNSDTQLEKCVDTVSNPELEELRLLEEQFTPERTRKLLRKVDFRLVPMLAICYLLAFIDRSNMGNVRVFGIEKELGLKPQQWNNALMVFFFSYAAIEIPSAIALKKLGPRIWLPIIMTSFGAITIAEGFVKNYGGLVTCRLLLGAAEGGLFPATGWILSLWYKGPELQKRIAGFYTAGAASGAFSGLLAYAIANLDHVHGHRAWRWVFWVEGTITTAFGLLGFLLILGVPEKAGSWLTEDEKRFLVLRKKYEQSDIPITNDFSSKYIVQALVDWKTYVAAAWYFSNAVANYGLQYTFPTILVSFGYTAARAQAMTAPPFIFACFATIVSSILADKYQRRVLVLLVSYIVCSIAYIPLIVLRGNHHYSGISYGAIFFAAAGLYGAAPCYIAFLGVNTAGQSKRAAALGIQTMIGTLGGALGSNIYLSKQAPKYPLGFGMSFGMLAGLGVVPAIIAIIAINRVNKKRAQMDRAEIERKYTPQQLLEMGDASPLFRLSL
ncbi:MFS general substrate transporter [Meredithblackwellia eburnea MCA 4105]